MSTKGLSTWGEWVRSHSKLSTFGVCVLDRPVCLVSDAIKEFLCICSALLSMAISMHHGFEIIDFGGNAMNRQLFREMCIVFFPHFWVFRCDPCDGGTWKLRCMV